MPPSQGAFVSLLDALIAFTKTGFWHFAWRTLKREPIVVVRALAVLLLRWTLLLAVVPAERWFGAAWLKWAWVILLLAAGLFRFLQERLTIEEAGVDPQARSVRASDLRSGAVSHPWRNGPMPKPFLQRALRAPSYGWSRGDALYVPTTSEIWREWRSRLNLFASRKAWLSVTVWSFTLLLLPFGVTFLLHYFSWKLMLAGFLYSMVWLGTHGTVYLHRFGTHRAFTFRNRYYRFVCQNLALKIVPEEVYIVSHHVHHAYSDLPGDPYNARAGFLYCFLAADLHQQINPALSQHDYVHVAGLLTHTGLRPNSYEQYLSWGSVTHPVKLVSHYLLNWAFWYCAFYLLGGHALATALFGWAAVWGIGIRAHNYDLHAGGKDRRRDGRDFDGKSLAVNRFWPGIVAGEWHNNHHLFPTSVRTGFLPWQVDSAFTFIRFYRLLGGVSSWRDFRDKFYERHYQPYVDSQGERTLEHGERQG